MGRRKTGQPPAYLAHKASGQAYSTYGGKTVYFGAYGTSQSRRKHAQLVKRWEREHGAEIVAKATADGGMGAHIAAYLADIRDSLSDIEHYTIGLNLGTLRDTFPGYEPDDFRAADLKKLRDLWAGPEFNHARKTINKALGRVKRFFRWMVAEERCSFETYAVLNALAPISQGKMRDNDPVEPVPLADLEATLPHIKEPGRTIILVQLYGGPRSSEACRMRSGELFRGGEVQIGRRVLKVPDGVWIFLPGMHKTRKRGKIAAHVIGPRLQAILTPWLKADPLAPMFINERGQVFNRNNLYRAVERAVAKANVPHWFPHQVRHLFVTEMDRASDLVTASEGAGHAGIETSLIYLQRRLTSVADVARRIG